MGQMCWKDVYPEKKEVYGIDIVCQAIHNVITCSGCNATIPDECVEYIQ